VQHSKTARFRSESGQKHALPQRTIYSRFVSISRHAYYNDARKTVLSNCLLKVRAGDRQGPPC
jgi:hypothetical protein